MTTFYLSAPQLAALATLTHAGSKDTMTPILSAVNITATPATVTALASDRYIAARATFPLGDTAHTLPDDGVTLIVNGFDLTALAKEKVGFMLTVSDDGRTVTAEGDAYGVKREFLTATGNFPPIGRLFPDETPDDIPGGVLVSMALLGRLAKLTLPGERPVDAAKAPYALTYRDLDNGNKRRAPILAAREHRGASLAVLVQPNMRTAA